MSQDDGREGEVFSGFGALGCGGGWVFDFVAYGKEVGEQSTRPVLKHLISVTRVDACSIRDSSIRADISWILAWTPAIKASGANSGPPAVCDVATRLTRVRTFWNPAQFHLKDTGHSWLLPVREARYKTEF